MGNKWKKQQHFLKSGIWVEITASFKYRFQGEWGQIMLSQHFYSSYIPAVDFSYAYSRKKVVFHWIFVSFRHVAGKKQICHISIHQHTTSDLLLCKMLLFNMMLSINKIPPFQAVSSHIDFGFSFYLPYHYFFCWPEWKYHYHYH